MKKGNNRYQHLIRTAGLVGAVMATGSIQAGEEIDRSLDAAPDGAVHIRNTRGEIDVKGWDKNQVRVKGELDDLTEEFIFEADDKVTTIRVEMEKRSISHGDGSDLEIWVPSGSKVWFEGVSSDFDISNISGGSSIKTVSGDIHAEGLSERIQINAVSGDVEIEDSTAKIKITTVSGDMEIKANADAAAFSTVSGDIEAELGTYSKLSVSSVSGEIEVSGSLADSGNVSAESVSGEVHLHFNGAVNAEVTARAGIGGDIENGLNDQRPKEKFPGGARLSTRVGEGEGRVKVGTVSGDIRLTN